ncbi:hypothetical protein RCL1_005991 [Eukaryota sp. TZLM3-RCL]
MKLHHQVDSISVFTDLDCSSSFPVVIEYVEDYTLSCSIFPNGFTIGTVCTLLFSSLTTSNFSLFAIESVKILEIEVTGYSVYKCYTPVNVSLGVTVSGKLTNITSSIHLPDDDFEVSYQELEQVFAVFRAHSEFAPGSYNLLLRADECYKEQIWLPIYIPHGDPVYISFSPLTHNNLNVVVSYYCFDSLKMEVSCGLMHYFNSSLTLKTHNMSIHTLEFHPSDLSATIYGFHEICMYAKEFLCGELVISQVYSEVLFVHTHLTSLCELDHHFYKTCSHVFLELRRTTSLPFDNSTESVTVSDCDFELNTGTFQSITDSSFSIISEPNITITVIIIYDNSETLFNLVSLACPHSKLQLSDQRCVCPPGQEMNFQGSCSHCLKGFYSQHNSCVKCNHMRTTVNSGAKSLSECVCVDGHVEVNGFCTKCPAQVVCREGQILSVKNGFLFNHTSEMALQRCLVPSFCINNTCASGRFGVSCTRCAAPNSYFDCSQRFSPFSYVLLILLIILVCIAYDNCIGFPIHILNERLRKQYPPTSNYHKSLVKYSQKLLSFSFVEVFMFITVILHDSLFVALSYFHQILGVFCDVGFLVALLSLLFIVVLTHLYVFKRTWDCIQQTLVLNILLLLVGFELYATLLVSFLNNDNHLELYSYSVIELTLLSFVTFKNRQFLSTLLCLISLWTEWLPKSVWNSLNIVSFCLLVIMRREKGMVTIVIWILLVVRFFFVFQGD